LDFCTPSLQGTYSKLGVNGGFMINYPLSNKILIGTGISYINRGFASSISIIDPWGNLSGLHKLIYNLNYLTLPFKLGYTLVEVDKIVIKPYIGVGVSWLFNIYSQDITVYDSYTERTYNKYPISFNNLFSLSGSIGVDFLYQYNNKLDFFISPDFDIIIFSPFEENSSSFKPHYWDLGIRMGIRRKF
jgi:hypothetical protein